MRMPTSRRPGRMKGYGVLAVACLFTALSSLSSASAVDTGGGSLGDPYYPDDGNSGYDVRHYDVHLTYDPAHPDHLEGNTTITAHATGDLRRFHLDLTGFDVTSVTVDGTPTGSIAREGAHELVVTPVTPVQADSNFTVRVRYAGDPVGEGWHRLDDGGADAVGEPHVATSWFPANDHPSDKATMSLTATVPDGWSVVGNGRPGPVTHDGQGRTTYRWREDRPMVTYASTVAIDRFTVHRGHLSDGTPVINAYSPGALIDPDAEAQQNEIIEFLASLFGPYPYSSAGAVVMMGRHGNIPAMETQSRPTYDYALFDVAIAHEMAHQWFGDSVSISDWRDGCVSECFAEYAQWLWYEHQGDDIDGDYYLPSVDEALRTPEFWDVPLYDPGAGKELDSALYERGPLMLHALRRTIGDETFFALLKRWQSDHRYGNASLPQFERLAGKMSGTNLTGFFHAWNHSTKAPPPKYLYPGTLSR